ncbi:MAG: type IV toxin-antitoxin system AbiEi family antitoxin [Gammaproteobacteria bacterium]
MNNLSGISKLNQKRLTTIIDTAYNTITIEEAAIILRMPKNEAAKLMSRWVEQGRIVRIKRGLYLSIKPEERTLSVRDSWVIATKIYSPCYIGALSAAEHWGLTNQKFSGIQVLSTQKPRNRNLSINNIPFSIRTISQHAMFGLESITHQQEDVFVSNPSRTIIDFLVDPQLGGGIYHVMDIFNKYLKSEHRNVELLFAYAKKVLIGAVLKRLGFLSERCQSGEFGIIDYCHLLKNSGYVKLDPKLGGNKLLTRWGLWV